MNNPYTSQVVATDMTCGYRVTIFKDGKVHATKHFPTGPFSYKVKGSMHASINAAYAKAKAYAQSYGC